MTKQNPDPQTQYSVHDLVYLSRDDLVAILRTAPKKAKEFLEGMGWHLDDAARPILLQSMPAELAEFTLTGNVAEREISYYFEAIQRAQTVMMVISYIHQSPNSDPIVHPDLLLETKQAELAIAAITFPTGLLMVVNEVTGSRVITHKDREQYYVQDYIKLLKESKVELQVIRQVIHHPVAEGEHMDCTYAIHLTANGTITYRPEILKRLTQ